MLASMERLPLVIGNWKMELSHRGQLELARSLKQVFKGFSRDIELVVCPSYPALAPVADLLKRTAFSVGAQHVHWAERGAWTGAVSLSQISPFVQWSLVGHSEQRALSRLTDEQVQVTAHLALQHGLFPVVCIGETREEYDADRTVEKVTAQMQSLLQKASRASLAKLVVAYEPIWAIGTGELPDPGDAASVMLLIRKLAAERFGNDVAERMRVIYGGSVKARNVAAYVAEPGVDGVLVGGASVHPREFLDIARLVQEAGR